MYKLSLPIQNKSINDENRPLFISLCKKAKIDRVFLTADINIDLESLKNNISIFKSEGFEVGIWVGNTIGHGATLLNSMDTGEKPKYQQLVTLEENALYSTNCPFDESFRRDMARSLARLTACGTDMLMLDDDFRISQHGKSPCCVCDLHMAKIREYLGEDISREELVKLAFAGGKNKYRDAFLRAQGESLEGFAKVIREEIDLINPDATISACSAYCSWDLDGTDPIRLTKIFAGKNKKFLRLHGAPYWAALNGKPVEAIPEFERMFASFCKDEDIEIFSEGDVYPRPRYVSPSSYLEIMDGALRADGSFDGILKYMLPYSLNPERETSYIERHVNDLGKLSDIRRFFKNGANAGVRVLIKPHLLADADLSVVKIRQQSPYPHAGIFLSMNAIPTLYSGEGICKAIFGESARHFDIADFKDGAILDGEAAMILNDRGIDVGIEEFKAWSENHFGGIFDHETTHGNTVFGGKIKRLLVDLKEGAIKMLSVVSDGNYLPLAYRYENAEGQKFMVFTFSSDALETYPKYYSTYEIQAALIRGIEWISGKAMPAKTLKEPELYTLCEKGENYTSVALFNCFHDSALNTVIELDTPYDSVEFSNCTGRIDGNKVYIEGEIHSFDFASFKAYN